jgi:hypothetical protein
MGRYVFYLSRIGRRVLLTRAPTCAVIMQNARHISILVYNIALSTESVGLRTSQLLHQSSSIFCPPPASSVLDGS